MISHGAWCRCTECTAPSERCPACQQGPLECRCSKYCRECGCVTNHTTQQHEEQERVCESCQELPKMDDDPETKWCHACWQEEQEWRFAEWVDNQAKEINHARDL